jgi:hypothetical protein
VDFSHSPTELDLLARLHDIAATEAKDHDLLALASAGKVLVEIETALTEPAFTRSELHERLLVVEEAARMGLPALPGLPLLVGIEVLHGQQDGSVAVLDRQKPGPVRNVQYATSTIVLDGPEAWVLDTGHRPTGAIESSFGYPYGEPPDGDGIALSPNLALLARSRWELMMAAEIAGTASGALQHVTDYLRTRKQFGQQLSSFQALRHRVAELAVSTEAAIWLTREAAWHRDPYRVGLALSYARDLAAAMVPEVVQLCGARGLTKDFPAHLFAMRLEGLRLEVGSADRLAKTVLDRT